MNKICKICGEDDQSKFYASNKVTCKKCVSDRVKSRYLNLSEQEKKEYLNRSAKWQEDNFFQYRFLQAKVRAKRKNISLEIDADFLKELWNKQEGKCFFSNIKMKKDGTGNYTGSLDRINSNMGYTKENVVFVLSIVNSMKNSLSENEFFNLIEVLYKNKRLKK